MRVNFLGLFFVLVSTLAFGDQPKAWREARWGMTPAQVLKAFPKTAEAVPKKDAAAADDAAFETLARIPSVDVDGMSFEVTFDFLKEKLVGVRLTRELHDPSQFQNEFEALKSLLNAKYGKPSSEKTTANGNKELAWDTPATGISLYTMDLSRINNYILIVLYGQKVSTKKRTENL